MARAELADRRFRSLLGLVFAILILMNIGFAVAVMLLEPREPAQDLARAESFFEAIVLGNEIDEAADRSGYEAAWDLLLPRTRERTAFGDFLVFFHEQVDEHGFIQSWHRDSREYGHYGSRRLRFEAQYAQRGEDPTMVVYEITMAEEDGRYGVSEYALISASRKSD